MKHDSIRTGKRKAVNLTLDTGVVAAAREAGLSLSRVAEDALRLAVKREEDRRWKERNRPAMEAWNDWLEENGMPYADLRVR